MIDALYGAVLALLLAFLTRWGAGASEGESWSLACFFLGVALFPLLEVFRPRRRRALRLEEVPLVLRVWRPGRIATAAAAGLWVFAGIAWLLGPREEGLAYAIPVSILGLFAFPRVVARARRRPRLTLRAEQLEVKGGVLPYAELGAVRLTSEEAGLQLYLWRARPELGVRLREEVPPDHVVELQDFAIEPAVLVRFLVERRRAARAA